MLAPPALFWCGGVLYQTKDALQSRIRFRKNDNRRESRENPPQAGHLKPAKQVGSQNCAGLPILKEVQKPEEGIGSGPEVIPAGRTAQNVVPYVGEGLVDPGPQDDREPLQVPVHSLAAAFHGQVGVV